MSRCPFEFAILLAIALGGCGGSRDAPTTREESYKTLAKADEAYQAKKYAEAIPGYDETIAKAAVQGDVLAETYLKRAVCKMETGDVSGAESDLGMADRGGAGGDDYESAQKRLKEKRAGR